MNKYVVCVYGAASDKISQKYKKSVELLGYELGKSGYSLVFGAGSTGLMGAVANGFKRSKADILGVAPHFMREFEPIYADCTQTIYTDSMSERKSVMEFSANAFIIVPGGIGTMDEFFQILTLKQLKRHNKPIVLFNYNGFYNSLINLIDEYIKKGFIGEKVRDCFVVCDDTEEVINYLNKIRLETSK